MSHVLTLFVYSFDISLSGKMLGLALFYSLTKVINKRQCFTFKTNMVVLEKEAN